MATFFLFSKSDWNLFEAELWNSVSLQLVQMRNAYMKIMDFDFGIKISQFHLLCITLMAYAPSPSISCFSDHWLTLTLTDISDGHLTSFTPQSLIACPTSASFTPVNL